MNNLDIPFLSAMELGHLIRAREISPIEATQAYLDRIEEIDGKLNSYITVCRSAALNTAEKVEEDVRSGNFKGPLQGVPYAVKDQFWTKGVLTTGGAKILDDFVPKENATVVQRLSDVGAILLGKLNMSEFATGNSVYHHWGTPRNPWDLERNPGTSSSGSGAATAAFLCATSLGEDTGGSIRNPANNSGLVGLLPTYGLVSRYGMLSATWSNDMPGPISRSVTDCAVTLKAIAGHDPKDRYSATRFVPDYLAGLNGDINGIRIGIVKEAIDADFIQPEVKRTIETAIKHLSEIGADVTNVSIPLLHYSAAVTRTIMEVEAASTHRSWLRTRPQDYEHNVLTDLLTGCIIPAELYYKAQKIRHLIRGQVISALDSVDVLVLPASSEPAPKIKTKAGTESKQEALLGVTGRRSLCSPFNLSNVPALVVPCGFVNTTGKEMPIGLQLAGRPFSDGMLLNVGYAYEQSTPWHRKRPPI